MGIGGRTGRTQIGTPAPVVTETQREATILPPPREDTQRPERILGNVGGTELRNRARTNAENRLQDTQSPEAQANPTVARDAQEAAAEAARAAGVATGSPRVGAGGPAITEADLPQVPSRDATPFENAPPPGPGVGPVTPTEPVVAAASLLSDDQFVPNPLSEFFNPTYHFRLLAVGDRSMVTALKNLSGAENIMAKIDSEVPTVTIAESGVTSGFCIKDVDMDAIIAPNPTSFNADATQITITVVEPLGAALFDALRDAAISLQTTNALRVFYILDLTFKGYDEAGVPQPRLMNSTMRNGGRWMWLIQITNIEAKLDSSGTTYTIKAIPFSQTIFDEGRYYRMEESAELPCGTVGEFLDAFQEHINQSWRNRLGALRGKEVVLFSFQTHPVVHPSLSAPEDPRGWRLTPLASDENPERHFSMIAGGAMARVPVGSNINQVIEAMFAHSEKAQSLGLDRGNATGRADASDTRINDRGMRESIVMRVEPEVMINMERGLYDVVSNTYMLDATLHIWPYYMQTVVLSDTQIENARAPDVQRRMLQRLRTNGLFDKRYDYLFTGKNTEVIDLDVGFNLPWSAVIPQIGGSRQNYEASEQNARRTDNNRNPQTNRPEADLEVRANEVRALTRELQGVNAELESLLGARRSNNPMGNFRGTDELGNEIIELENGEPNSENFRNMRNRIAALSAVDPRTTENAAEIARLQNEYQRMISRYNTLRPQQQGLITRINDARQSLNAEAQRRVTEATQAGALVSAGQRTFAEDRIRSSIDSTYDPMPISLRQSGDGLRSQSGTGFVGTRHIDKALFGAVLEQIYEPVKGFFINIEMTVRGDPYWLGVGGIERMLILRAGRNTESGIVGSATTSDASPNPNGVGNARMAQYNIGHVAFLLHFRYPLGINERTSVPIFRSQDTVNGLYTVTNVKSSFTEGQFRQVLTAKKHPLIDLPRLLLEERNPTTSSTPAALPPLPIPDAQLPPEFTTFDAPTAVSAAPAAVSTTLASSPVGIRETSNGVILTFEGTSLNTDDLPEAQNTEFRNLYRAWRESNATLTQSPEVLQAQRDTIEQLRAFARRVIAPQ